MIIFRILASASCIADANSNSIKTILAIDESTHFINGKPAVINGLTKLRSSHFWPVIFLVVTFSKIPLFSKDLFTFLISFISLFVRVNPEHVTDETLF